jgi:catechol 2,3-dioxygenase-like lactoylglutathione lyase family enzyme
MIHHVTRVVPPARLEACVEFYMLLGFEPVEPPAGIAGRALWLQSRASGPRTQVHLMPREGARAELGHLAVVCSEYEETLRRLRDAAHDVEPRREHWGSPRSYAQDPAGNIVELMAFPPAEDDHPPRRRRQ